MGEENVEKVAIIPDFSSFPKDGKIEAKKVVTSTRCRVSSVASARLKKQSLRLFSSVSVTGKMRRP